MAERIAVEKEMIALIRANILFGVAFAVEEREYDELFPAGSSPFGSAYSYCCWTCLLVIYNWIADNLSDSRIAYFFEAGHKDQVEANRIMNSIFNSSELRLEYRYVSHAFINKEDAAPIQAADILAWQHATHLKRLMRGIGPRADYTALTEDQPLELKIVRRDALLHMQSQVRAVNAGAQVITGRFGTFSFASVT